MFIWLPEGRIKKKYFSVFICTALSVGQAKHKVQEFITLTSKTIIIRHHSQVHNKQFNIWTSKSKEYFGYIFLAIF